MEQAVEKRRGDDVVAEDLAPLLEAPVGGEDHGAAFVLCVDELEEQVGAALGQRQIALRDKLIKIGAKVVRHGRYVTFQLAEVAIPRRLFAEILRLIDGLRPKPAPT